MAMADSVSVFAEGTFEEQIQELVNYLARGLSADERVAYIKPYQDVLLTPEGGKPIAEDEERRRKTVLMVVDGVKGLGDGSDREAEGFYNLLFAHLYALYPSDSPELSEQVVKLVQAIAGASPADHSAVKYRILTNLFNATPRRSSLRLQSYKTLLRLASANGDLSLLQIWRADLDGWLEDWAVQQEEKSAFLEELETAFEKAGMLEESYTFALRRLNSLPADSSSASSVSLHTISRALSLPFVYSFDALLAAPAMSSAKDSELFALLRVFFSGGLPEWNQWLGKEGAENVLTEFGLDKTQLERKIRLLALTSLAARNVGRDVPYADIAGVLDVPESQAEMWVMDVIRANLVAGKLSQPTRVLRVYRSSVRAFEREEWERLEDKVLAWRDGLIGMLNVMRTRRQTAEKAAAPAAATGVPAATAMPTTTLPSVNGDVHIEAAA